MGSVLGVAEVNTERRGGSGELSRTPSKEPEPLRASQSEYKVLEEVPTGPDYLTLLSEGEGEGLASARGPQGMTGKGLGTCAHVRAHVHAYGHTHVHTRTCPGRPPGYMHTPTSTHWHAHNTRVPRRGSGGEGSLRARWGGGAQQSTGTPSVEKIMPVVGS